MADLTDDINRVMEMDMLKTEFFSNISHELKTPLNVIWTSVQLLNSLNNGNRPQELWYIKIPPHHEPKLFKANTSYQ